MDISMWSKEHHDWIFAMDHLFNQLFGGDYLAYWYDESKGTSVGEDTLPSLLEYNHDEWEIEYLKEESRCFVKETASNASGKDVWPNSQATVMVKRSLKSQWS